MKLYRIKHWSEVFENSRSRMVEKLAWVAIPNRHDGENYTAMITQPDGAELFSAWVLIIQVASKCQPRGSLLRGDGKPHDAASLSLKTRAPANWFQKCFDWLEANTDWLAIENVADGRQVDARLMAPGYQAGDYRIGGEGENGKEGGEGLPAPAIDSEVPTEQQAIDAVMNDGIPADFCRLAYRDWSDNNGCNSRNVPKPWGGYVRTRWRYEQVEWRSGKHRGQQSLKAQPVGPSLREVKAYATDKGEGATRYAIDWHRHWSERKWERNGKSIDWQVEFSASWAKKRSEQ